MLSKYKVIILWKKSLFVFWPSPKNVIEPYCQKWAKNSISVENSILLLYPENQKSFFSHRNHFLFNDHVKKIPLLTKVEFLAHYWQFGPVTFFWLGQKTKSDFFHKRITSYLLSNVFCGQKNRLQYYTKTTLENFVIASRCGRF